ncbi:hypothetical protein BP00DRAFT_87933 [Aspergillus indologenus CBS 114.80]|uniref:Uncharacterized protein n=1 Tax=Aspergillus indologenus CBS 114.80 TaxID=1450541 RepID=A0A2V5HUF1_9EURO|nr:hypothetical protein BP00DRAFT_87933 [Aspergillus indologenus CBS 114.80]
MKSRTRLACMWFMQARSSIPSLGASTAAPPRRVAVQAQDVYGLTSEEQTPQTQALALPTPRPSQTCCGIARARSGRFKRIVTVTSAPNLPMPAADYRMRRCRGPHLQHALPGSTAKVNRLFSPVQAHQASRIWAQ